RGGAAGDLALDEPAAVDDEALDGLLDVVDLDEAAAGQRDRALVRELTAGLRIERGGGEDDLDLGRGLDRVDELAVHEDGLDGRGDRVLGVAEEGHLAAALGEQAVVHGSVGVAGLLRGRVRTGALTLLLHRGTEGVRVDLKAHLGRHLHGQVDGEAVGVVEAEGVLAGQHAAALLLHGARDLLEDRGAGLQGAAERLLLGVDDLRDAGEVRLELRVGLDHLVLGDGQERRHRRVQVAQQAHGADRAADQAAQHVAAALVAGAHAVGDEHEGAAHVVADDAEVDVVRLDRAVGAAGELLRDLDDGEDLVDLVHVLLALQQVGEALDAEAGVDRLLVQLAEQLVVLALAGAAQELVEDEVPDLEIA